MYKEMGSYMSLVDKGEIIESLFDESDYWPYRDVYFKMKNVGVETNVFCKILSKDGRFILMQNEFPNSILGSVDKFDNVYTLNITYEISKGIVPLIEEFLINPKYWKFILEQGLVGGKFDFETHVSENCEYANLDLPINPMTVEEYKRKLNDKYKDRLEWFEKMFPAGLYSKESFNETEEEPDYVGVNLITRIFLREMDEMELKRHIWTDEEVRAISLRIWEMNSRYKLEYADGNNFDRWWGDHCVDYSPVKHK